MKKRLVSLLLAFSMMLSILPVGAFADYSTRKEVVLKKANNGYFYPEGSKDGTVDAAGPGWSYDAGTDTLTFDAPDETVYLTTHESLYDYRILSNVEVKADTTLYGIKTQLHSTTNNYGTILYADFYSSGDGKGHCVLNNYGYAKGVSLGTNTVEADAIINNKSGGVINLYVSRTNNPNSTEDSTSDAWGSHITNEAGGTIQYAWFRRPIKNYGTLQTCQFTFSNAADPTLLNEGEIHNSTFFGTGQKSDVYITGSGSIDHSYFKSVVGSVQNTITNSVIETDTCNFTSSIDPSSLHAIRINEGTFSLQSRDAPTSAYTFNAVESISFVGSPKVYVYGSYGHDINRINGSPLVVSTSSNVRGVQSIENIGKHNWSSYTSVTFTPDGTQDIILSNATGGETDNPYTPTADDFDYKAPILNTDMVDDLANRLLEKITTKNGIDKKDVTLILCDANGNELDTAPTEVGKYTFKLSVKAAKDGSYAATPHPLTSDNWKFSIFTAAYDITVEGGQAYILNGDKKQPLSSETLVPPDTVLYLEPDAEHADASDFYGWYDAADPDKTPILDSFVMPHHDVTLKLLTAAPSEPDGPGPVDTDPSSSSAFCTALVVTAAGAVGYAAVTRIWLETILPKDAKIPTSRQQLADLLWEQAGKPEPISSALYTDISTQAVSSQKAARWCVEQGLISASGDKFSPNGYTFRPQVIKAWNQLQNTLNAAQ